MPNEKMHSRALPQPPDVATRVVIVTVAGFLGFVAVTMAGLFVYLRAGDPAAFRQPAEQAVPQPALQKKPQDDLKRFELEQRMALSGYGWIDRSQGLVRIPIEEAMRVIASRREHAYDPLEQPANPSAPSARDGAQP